MVVDTPNYLSDCRGCCKKVHKHFQTKRFCVSARLDEVDFSNFGQTSTSTAFRWTIPLLSSEKRIPGRIAPFSDVHWPKKCRFSQLSGPPDTVCLLPSHSPRIAVAAVVFLSPCASWHNVYNAHWMVAVRFFNLELGPIEFLTHWVQNFRVQNRLFKMVANTVDRNILTLASLPVSTTSRARVGRVPFALTCSEWNREVQKFRFEVSPVISLMRIQRSRKSPILQLALWFSHHGYYSICRAGKQALNQSPVRIDYSGGYYPSIPLLRSLESRIQQSQNSRIIFGSHSKSLHTLSFSRRTRIWAPICSAKLRKNFQGDFPPLSKTATYGVFEYVSTNIPSLDPLARVRVWSPRLTWLTATPKNYR